MHRRLPICIDGGLASRSGVLTLPVREMSPESSFAHPVQWHGMSSCLQARVMSLQAELPGRFSKTLSDGKLSAGGLTSGASTLPAMPSSPSLTIHLPGTAGQLHAGQVVTSCSGAEGLCCYAVVIGMRQMKSIQPKPIQADKGKHRCMQLHQ